eukprot:6136600-Pyramimonas_sp.AAC.1
MSTRRPPRKAAGLLRGFECLPGRLRRVSSEPSEKARPLSLPPQAHRRSEQSICYSKGGVGCCCFRCLATGAPSVCVLAGLLAGAWGAGL